MKKIISLVLMCCMMLSLCACGAAKPAQNTVTETPEISSVIPADAPTPAEEPDGSVQEFVYSGLSDEITAAIEDALQEINGVHPGTAGNSLRCMIAVGKILELGRISEGSDASEFEHICRLWFDANLTDEALRNAFTESFTAVSSRVREYLADPEAYAGEIEACGYVFGEACSEDQAEWVLNYMSIARANAE